MDKKIHKNSMSVDKSASNDEVGLLNLENEIEIRKERELAKKMAQKLQKNERRQKAHNKPVVKKDAAGEVRKKSNEKTVKITFLGGIGEIGKNMTAIEYDNEIIVVDSGLAFPTFEYPGVDLIVPDISYLLANKAKVKGFILTHGHEDHIGGLPYVLNDLKVPVYGTPMTLALVDNKMRERKINYKAVAVKPRSLLKIGSFQIEFIKVCHSIPGAVALCINTPVGNIIMTGDFKIDFTPVDGVITDLTRFGELGKRGVSLLMADSTNACRSGYSMSESNVGKSLERLFESNKDKRLFVATFASNIHRIQQILWLAEKFKRKVALAGRSMLNVVEAASRIGELKYDKNNIIEVNKLDKYAEKEILVISTGSQGEPMSALSRMAAGEFNKIKIGEGDTVILSSSPIPGNEKAIYNTINLLMKKGADVIYDELEDVHASGHACQEELKTIQALVSPKFFIPVHGEYRHLKKHKELAISMGINKRDVLFPDLGAQFELGTDFLRQIGHVTAGIRLVDGSGLGDVDSSVLKERKQLSEEGFCVAVLNMSNISGEANCEPLIITRGVVYDSESDQFVSDARFAISSVLREQDLRSMDPNEIKNNIKKVLSNFIYKRTQRRPIILVILLMN